MHNSAIAFITKLKIKVAFYLDDLETPIGKAISIAIALLVLISAGIFVAETYPISNRTQQILDIIDTSILYIFGLEYLLRFWCAEHKSKYFFSLYSLIDLIAILPFFLAAADTRYIRLLRWFRFLRIFRFLSKKSHQNQEFNIFARVIFTLLSIVFIFSGLVYQFEHVVNKKDFGTFLDAFYFSIFTMTTVGYGDVTPITSAGKLMTILMILTGIALIPIQLGELFKKLVKNANQVDITCSQCGFSQHDSDALCCKICGTKLL
ncbi:Kef-type K+ ransport system, predicted NAD-binding component [Synechococcus sp. PCC 7502]|uniref:ion transporter n=1 Tax=Synechococcus sp. PCC 7502 TaxID=1173263 RepID=UPI00029FE2A4|nr:ion transporter [Synechococcus sp. PCC 7502]AFY74154.1 Kef-type K+ ransport system, predicted NAD-binding component [Synechococcus sp. PCC 7502]